MDNEARYLGNTGYIIPGGDYYLLGVLATWATWFMISKTAQPLRLRGDRWQYRLFTQFLERLPIPEASNQDKETIAALARQCCRCLVRRSARRTMARHRARVGSSSFWGWRAAVDVATAIFARRRAATRA